MTTQLLFYDNVTPVSSQRHRDWAVEIGTDYAFARSTNSVPLTSVEFAHAAREYAIVFAGDAESMMPAVVLGVGADRNFYVAEDGSWNAKYIPAFVRRYPFVFSTNDKGATFTLCIDESFGGFNQDGRGQRLFDDQGERTEYLERVLGFLRSYQAEFRRTKAFCQKLRELELLEPMQAQFRTPSGKRGALTGFMVVSRDKLKNLSGEKLAELAKSDELELAYTHLQSMHNFRFMLERAPAPEMTAGTA